MIIHKSKKEYGDAEITDRWSTFRGIFPDPSREEYKLIEHFLYKFAWELDDFDESRQRWVSLKNRLQCPNLRDLLRKFIRQVRASKGYDVEFHFDFIVPPYPVFIPRSLDDKKFYNEAMAAAKFAIHQINSSTMRLGKTHELVSVDKMVWTTHEIIRTVNMMLLTFTVKKITATANVDSDAVVKTTFNAKRIVSATNVDSDAVVKKTIQAMIELCDQPPSCFLLKEWKYKPFLME